MRREYGGVEVDLGDLVYVFDLWNGRPVFHSVRGGKIVDGVLVARCGRSTRREKLRDAVGMPPRHAVRFGRPCSVCWPELRSMPDSLLDALAGSLVR